ncbi:Argininosuccinate lyase [Porphyridium purpureum]|uniref:Argininosuccinate lyase n=1 Tax=Porphyridium purpureum TaxID=35688 RepID=A0A5J4Z7Y8_PORPP|nr:Argininosuccinate lyase [Porphyridium purpureum]|eukprot:POR9403..scf295_1
MAMWGGRFDAAPTELVAKMGESVSYDHRLYAHDIRGSIAHAKMLAKQGIITADDAHQIEHGLLGIKSQIDAGAFTFDERLEDIHMNIEARLTENIGSAGAKLHSARSRNDQIATDSRLYLRDELDTIKRLVRGLQIELIKIAREHTDTILPGFTHLQHAQPIVLGHYMLAYTEMFDRDHSRLEDCQKRFNYLPLGSGALAGSTLPIDREFVCKELEFLGCCRNSMDATADRDYMIELLSSLSIIMMHLSRMSEDLVFWMSQEAGWIELGDAFCTGSSLMPQKKNPDMCELTRGKTGRVYGDLMALLSIMKSLPLCYNRDMQEDKEPVFDAVDTVKLVLSVYAPMIASMKVNKDRMYEAASDPALMATDLAEWLVKNNVPFRSAHHRVGALVGYCKKAGKRLDEVTLEEMQACVPEANEECLALWKPESSVALRESFGGTAPNQVRTQIAYWMEQDFVKQLLK